MKGDLTMENVNIQIIITRKQAEQLMNLLGMQSETSIKKQYEFIKEGYSDETGALFNYDYPNASVEKMNDVSYKLFSKLSDRLNPSNVVIDLT